MGILQTDRNIEGTIHNPKNHVLLNMNCSGCTREDASPCLRTTFKYEKMMHQTVAHAYCMICVSRYNSVRDEPSGISYSVSYLTEAEHIVAQIILL